MPARVIAIVFDATNRELIDQLVADDRMPNLARLRADGLTGAIDGLPGLYVGSTWPSLYTGLNPAGHGHHRLAQLRPGTYDFSYPLMEEDGIGGVPLWERLSKAGRRIAVLDLPLTRPAEGVDGLWVSGWGAHDELFGLETIPTTVADEIRATYGDYPAPINCDTHGTAPGDIATFLDQVHSAIETGTELTCDMLQRDEWDLFMQVFIESHCVGHQCWHLHDESHPNFDPGLRERVGNPLESVYTALDRALGRVLEKAGDATVMVLSPHGMASYRGADLLLTEILVRLGAANRPAPGPPPSLARRLRLAVSRARKALPDPINQAIKRARSGSEHQFERPRLRFDLSTSKCFPVPNARSVSGIRLNLQGREPTGVLAPGTEVDSFCEQLTADLLEIVDGRTGEPLVSRVHRTAELYEGPRLDALPDILVEWSPTSTGTTAYGPNPGAIVTAVSPKIGSLEASNGYIRTGDHVPDGWFTVVGPGLGTGEIVESTAVTDIYPTLCALMGVEPGDVDGQSIDLKS